LGLLLFSLAARRRGWKVSYLGQATPLANAEDVAAVARVNRLAISITTVVSLARLLEWWNETARLGGKLLFGGQLLNAVPALQGRLPGVFLGKDSEIAARNLDQVQVPKRFWSPDPRALQTARDLQMGRLNLAGQITAQVLPFVPDRRERSFDAPEIGYATLVLLDLLACAIVFDTPELVDLHTQWLRTMLAARQIDAQALTSYWQVARKALKRMLPADESKQAGALLSRLAGD
jgi:hypothetical protein